MKLHQFSKVQLQRLQGNSGSDSDDVKHNSLIFLDQSIPPSAVLERSLRLFDDSVSAVWALPYFIIKENSVMGCCGFKSAPVERFVEIGYNVAPSARGQGVATVAISLLCQIAFESVEVDTVVALIAPENGASLRVVSKNHFVYKGNFTDTDHEIVERWELYKI